MQFKQKLIILHLKSLWLKTIIKIPKNYLILKVSCTTKVHLNIQCVPRTNRFSHDVADSPI